MNEAKTKKYVTSSKAKERQSTTNYFQDSTKETMPQLVPDGHKIRRRKEQDVSKTCTDK